MHHGTNAGARAEPPCAVAVHGQSLVGVGILRLPGTVAAALGDRTLIMVAWDLGGLYALMGAVAVAELAAMIPETGGFRVYARRAFGEGVGFAVGWVDWLIWPRSRMWR
jgi:amino acid transporter